MGNVRWLLAMLAIAVAPAILAAQQPGTIQGTVTDAVGQPLAGVQISVVGTGLGTLSDGQGRYRLDNVPAGTHQIRFERLGFAALERAATVAAGAIVTLNVQLQQEVVALRGIVVTGVAEATAREKLPITVDQLWIEDLPVPTTMAGSIIQGKVAGATVVQGSGRPGAAAAVMLRGPTSINAGGRNQEPLWIVDGVILSSSMVDIDALDIESIEVVKGASAASLYGSRAAAGVIQVTTRRGRGIREDMVRYTARSEMGTQQLPGRFNLTSTHPFAMTADGSRFIDPEGNPCDWLQCGNVSLAGQRALPGDRASNWNTIMSQQWPGVTYDQVGEFYTAGLFQQHYMAAEGRSGATNYHVSYSHLHDRGVMPGQEGFRRHNFRLNLDQSVNPALTLSGSAFYSTSAQDHLPESQGNPIFRLTRMPAGVNLRACIDDPTADCTLTPEDRLNRLIIRPDPFAENDNPLYQMYNREYELMRGRFLGSANLRWRPTTWFHLDANASYDRLDYSTEDYYPLGYRDIRETFAGGDLYRSHSLTEGFNSSVTGTFRTVLGDWGSNRTQFRYLWEQEDYTWTTASGRDFVVGGVPHFGNIPADQIGASSGIQPVRSDGFFAITNFDLMERYIIDALVRNDGSSLFGRDERRQWYYRIAGAWRISEEPWLNIRGLDEFKLRYSLGTAGGRPSWAAQYETYSVAAGRVSPITLGNRDLKPEFSTEHEVGIEAMFLDRFDLTVNYATTETTDQILSVPLPPYFGFSSQWQNAGTLESNTWEMSFNARLVTRPDFSWSARLLFDRTRHEITFLNRPAYVTGVGGQAMGDVFYIREGEALGTFYGTKVATSCAHLPAGVSCDGFMVNDEGLLVWVGDAGHYNNGWETKPGGGHWWGSTGPEIPGIGTVNWGTPFKGLCIDRVTGEETDFCPVGTTTPDYSMSLSSTINWRGFSVYGLIDAVQGFDVFNQPLMWAVFENYAGIMDQSGVPENQQRPLGYYSALYAVSGLGVNSAFTEDGSFVKLRELAVRYRIDGATLARVPGFAYFDGVTLSAIGRNLFTWTGYDGYDPEVGRGGGATGSATLARVDGYNYPNFRTFTFSLELNF